MIVKPDETRETMYDTVVTSLQEKGIYPAGRTKEGILYVQEDGTNLVVKVIKKKVPVPADQVKEVKTYATQLAEYEEHKAETKKDAEEELEPEVEFTPEIELKEDAA